MTFSQKVAVAASTFALTVGTLGYTYTPAQAATDTEATSETPAPEAKADRPLFVNPLDPSQWYDGTDGMDHADMGKPEAINMAHPEFYLSFMDPDTHTKRHMQFLNPAMYAEFMDPGTYMQFANPENWMAWLYPSNYEMLIEAETYTYWMQPGAYTHALMPHGYLQMFDLKNYADYVDPATYLEMFDVSAYDIVPTAEGVEKTMDDLNPVNLLGYATSLLTD